MSHTSEDIELATSRSNTSGSLSISKKLPKHALQPLIDKMANHQGQMMNRSGRLALIKSTLSATSTHLAINLGLPPWFLKVMEKIMKCFLWSGTDSVQGGKCLMAWGCVQRPLELRGLGILDPKQTLWAGSASPLVVAPVRRAGPLLVSTAMSGGPGNGSSLLRFYPGDTG
jgi:hypothetical protein